VCKRRARALVADALAHVLEGIQDVHTLPTHDLRPRSRLKLNLECSSTRRSNHRPETQDKSDSYSLAVRTPRR
jgi:hypothetical protein